MVCPLGVSTLCYAIDIMCQLDKTGLMNNDIAYLPSSFLNVLLRYLDERELSAQDLRGKISQLAQHQRVENRTFSSLLNDIYKLDPVPALGLRIGSMALPQHFGLVGYLLASCSTLGQALIRYRRFQTLVLTDLRAEVQVQGSDVKHQWILRGKDNPLSYEFSAAIFINLYQSLIKKPVAPARVGLPIARPKHGDIYQAILGCPVEFDCLLIRVDIPSTVMLMDIATRDPHLLKIFDQQAAAMLNQNVELSESFDHFLKGLQEHLLVAMKDGDTRACTLAAKMGYSLRSFYRKLGDNGHSYRAVLASTRSRLAVRYLVDPALSPSEVALLLGYSEQSAFIRAFKNWMGMTPGEYRKSLVTE